MNEHVNPDAEAFGQALREGLKGPERVAVFDLPSLFWTVAKAREGRDKDPKGAALAALRHARDLCEKVGCARAVFASERKPYWRQSASVQGVKVVAKIEANDRTTWTQTEPLIPYKVGRSPKSEALKVELTALEWALDHGGFQVLAVEEGRPYDQDEPEGGQGSGPRACWFEADDVAASLAVSFTAEGWHAVLVSNDWDLAGVLAHAADDQSQQNDFAVVSLARVSGERDRYVTAQDVRREFGVPPSRLWEYLALAGDGDFKPYPGALKPSGKKRAPGIGEQGAKEVLALFGGFDAAVLQALSSEPAPSMMPAVYRALTLIRAGGLERAQCAKQLAQLRFDVPVSAAVIEGVLRGGQDWDRAEAMLKSERGLPSPEILPPLDVILRANQAAPVCPRCLGVEPGKAAGDPEEPHPGPFTETACGPCALAVTPQAAIPCAGGPACKPQYDELGIFEVDAAERACSRAQHRRELRKHVSEAEVDAICPPAETDLDKLQKLTEQFAAEDAQRPPGEVAREAREIDSALAPKVRVVLTRAEFWALAPLVAAEAACMLGEVSDGVRAVLRALTEGEFVDVPDGHVLTTRVSPEAADALDRLGELAACAAVGREPGVAPTSSERAIVATPGFLAFARYGAQLVRA